MTTDKEQSRRRVQSIEVGFRVLRVLRMAEGALPLREIAARASMPPSKVHLYLVSFVRENMAYQDPQNGHYGLGSFAIQLGLAAIRQLDVVTLAADALTELRDKTDCAIYLSLWGDRGPCIVAKADGRMQGSFSVRLGYILPLTTTATGLVFLANLPPYDTERALEAQRAYDGENARAPSPEDLAASLDTVRGQGYASTVGMLNRNFAGIAAPILDYSGKIAATLTLLGHSEFLGKARHKEFVKLLLDAAGTVSQRMGAAPGMAGEAD
ncbi:IclR family transcriptional regulator [Sphingomonas sp. HF-S4]|uniref:IclR family transcriptional regulator n=1 Tax=Sphingomonas agrestis TaxID=3080540 RepID=A0ABU3Y532_9SPHN|nr:IclR family transcriptional regulator [Sphingomonas sp. HF-S4]MDV3456528.1 IclR family transcriptional regulator [Sphingomonas sp. HF-S4]